MWEFQHKHTWGEEETDVVHVSINYRLSHEMIASEPFIAQRNGEGFVSENLENHKWEYWKIWDFVPIKADNKNFQVRIFTCILSLFTYIHSVLTPN